MSKYTVKRNDDRDNSDEEYVVIRVDLGAKDVHRNRKAVRVFCKILEGSSRGKSSIDASRDIVQFIDGLEKDEDVCNSCKGKGSFEQSAGSHSFFIECKKCKGSGLVKILI